MSDFKKLGHSIYNHKYHIVWCPKYRYKVLQGEVRLYIRDVLRKYSCWIKIEIVEGKVQSDHVHIVLDIAPKHSVSSIIGELKGRAAVSIFRKFPKMYKKYWGRHFWCRGYCSSTIGLDEMTIREYVRNQQEKDRMLEQQDLFQRGRAPL